MHYYIDALKKYADFKGRSTRREFWMFVLISSIIAFGIGFLEGFFSLSSTILSDLYSLFVFLPSLAIGVRRMHDSGNSGWYIIIPFINLYYLLVGSQKGTNEYDINSSSKTANKEAVGLESVASKKLSTSSSGKRPALSKEDVLSDSLVKDFIRWFIENDRFVKSIASVSSNIIFNEGTRPNVELGYQVKNDNDLTSLEDWFITKLTHDIRKLSQAKSTEFSQFLDKLGAAGDRTIVVSGEIAIKYHMNLDNFVYEKEIVKIPDGTERATFKKNFLEDQVSSSELRILGWLYHEWFGEWY